MLKSIRTCKVRGLLVQLCQPDTADLLEAAAAADPDNDVQEESDDEFIDQHSIWDINFGTEKEIWMFHFNLYNSFKLNKVF